MIKLGVIFYALCLCLQKTKTMMFNIRCVRVAVCVRSGSLKKGESVYMVWVLSY